MVDCWHISRLLQNATTKHPSVQHQHPSHPIPSSLGMVGPTTHPGFCFAPSRTAGCSLEHTRNISQAQHYSLPVRPSPSFDASLQGHLTPGPSTMAPCLSLLAASTVSAFAPQQELHGAAMPAARSQKTRGHVLQGRTHGGMHVPQPRESTGPFQYFRIRVRSAPQNGCFFQADRNLHPCWVSKWSRDVSLGKSMRQA